MRQPENKEHTRRKPIKVGITLGDINGIGPELVLKAFQHPALSNQCITVLYGSLRVMNIYKKVLRIPKFNYNIIKDIKQAQAGKLNIIDCAPDVERVEIGKPSKTGAKVGYEALRRALEDAKYGELDALVTLPVDKATLRTHYKDFIGHTELLKETFNVADNVMLMVSDQMRVGLVTGHVPIKHVAKYITKENIIKKLRLMHTSLQQDFNITKPVIAVLGLNPHAGDEGLIGKEEQEVIQDAVQEINQQEILAMGPFAPDGFWGSLAYKKYDAILAMYHDQGLIPFKLMTGFSGVNYTAGIPLVRTSPAHGVAYDIAGKGIADHQGFLQALYTAIDVYHTRKENQELKANALQKISVTESLGDDAVISEEAPPEMEE